MRLSGCLIAVIALLVGCAGDEGATEPSTIGLVPAGRQIATLDLAAARDRGEPKDSLVAAVLPDLVRSDRDVVEAIELRKVRVITSGGSGETALTAIESEKPADDVLERLQRGGWKRRGSFLEGPEGRWAGRTQNGILLLGNSRRALTNALEGTNARGPALAAIGLVDGPLRLGFAAQESRCIKALAGDEDELVIKPRGRPDRGRVALRGEEFGRPKVDGSVLRIPVSGSETAAVVARRAVKRPSLNRIYRCD